MHHPRAMPMSAIARTLARFRDLTWNTLDPGGPVITGLCHRPGSPGHSPPQVSSATAINAPALRKPRATLVRAERQKSQDPGRTKIILDFLAIEGYCRYGDA